MDKKTVLYIEDSSAEREVVCRLLASEIMEVIAAGEAEEGLELARSFKPDLILLDLHLPGMDGCAIARNLRGIPHLEPVPIIAFSASIDEGEKEEAMAYCDGFMEKPVDVRILPDRVLELIEAGRGGGRMVKANGTAAAAEGEATSPGEAGEVLQTLEAIRAVMSHDLRTPLTVIISYASTVAGEKAGPLNDKQKELLETLVEHGFKMDNLITDLVHIARETLKRHGYPPK